jgi:hypothetical protein
MKVFLCPISKSHNSITNQITATSFHIFSDSLFIHYFVPLRFITQSTAKIPEDQNHFISVKKPALCSWAFFLYHTVYIYTASCTLFPSLFMIYLITAVGSLDHTCIALMICEK